MLPPLAVDLSPSASVEITPPFPIERLPAPILTSPALPSLPCVDLDEMPVKEVWDTPSIVSRPATLTETSPALPEPGPRVSEAILPSLTIAKVPAVTERLPPVPERGTRVAIPPHCATAGAPAL